MAHSKSSVEFRSKILDYDVTHTYHFKWRLENILKLPLEKVLLSPEFSPGLDYKWYAEICLTRFDTFHFKFTSLQKMLEKNGKFKICVLDTKGICLMKKSLTKSLYGKDVFSEYFDKCIVSPPNDVIVNVLIELFDQNIETQMNMNLHSSSQSELLEVLSKNYRKMYEDSVDTDVTFCMGSNRLKAHKAVLRVHSNAFDKMFEHQFLENQNNVINIEDISYSVMNELLLFMYTGRKKDFDYSTALELYRAADKYEMTNLRLICGNILLDSLTVDNIFDIIVLADRHADVYLKDNAKLFVIDNFCTISPLHEWKDFVVAEGILASEILTSSPKTKAKIDLCLEVKFKLFKVSFILAFIGVIFFSFVIVW